MKKILVIDDNQDFREMLSFILTGEGYKVLVASDGKDGAIQVHRDRPDLVLMDVMMPGHGGKETAEYLKAMSKFSDIPVIFITGVVTPDRAEGGNIITVDGRDYPMIPKPVDREDLIRRVRAILGA